MSGRHPFGLLTKGFTDEDWELVEAKKAEMRAEEARNRESAGAAIAANAVPRRFRSRSSPRPAPKEESARR